LELGFFSVLHMGLSLRGPKVNSRMWLRVIDDSTINIVLCIYFIIIIIIIITIIQQLVLFILSSTAWRRRFTFTLGDCTAPHVYIL